MKWSTSRWMKPAAVCAACSAYGIALMLAHPAGALHAAGAALFCSLGLYLAGFVALLLAGGGKFSVDKAAFGKGK